MQMLSETSTFVKNFYDFQFDFAEFNLPTQKNLAEDKVKWNENYRMQTMPSIA